MDAAINGGLGVSTDHCRAVKHESRNETSLPFLFQVCLETDEELAQVCCKLLAECQVQQWSCYVLCMPCTGFAFVGFFFQCREVSSLLEKTDQAKIKVGFGNMSVMPDVSVVK